MSENDTYTDGSERYEVIAETKLGEKIELGKPTSMPAACQLIESVDTSKYQPVEYHIRPLQPDNGQSEEVDRDV